MRFITTSSLFIFILLSSCTQYHFLSKQIKASDLSITEIVSMRSFLKKKCKQYNYFDELFEEEFNCIRCNKRTIGLLRKYKNQLFLGLSPAEIRETTGIVFKDDVLKPIVRIIKRKEKFVGQIELLLKIELDELKGKVIKVTIFSNRRYET